MNITIQNKNKTRFEKIISDDGPIYEHIMTRKHQGYNNPKNMKSQIQDVLSDNNLS